MKNKMIEVSYIYLYSGMILTNSYIQLIRALCIRIALEVRSSLEECLNHKFVYLNELHVKIDVN